MISCRDLTRFFGDLRAVQGLTLEVPCGEICVMLGPNGAGKSTTIKMLTGLLAPTSGEAHVAGLDVTPASKELKSRIGVLPENLGLFDDLTVEEHLWLTGRIYGLGRSEVRSRAEQLLQALDLDHGRHTFAASCSHGMRKKTAFAMALLPNPQVLFLDEPFEAVDPVASRTIEAILVMMARRGVTVFVTTHVLPVAERLADRLVIVREGRVVWNEAKKDLPRPLEEHYFSLVQAPMPEDLPWLGCSQS